MINRRAELYVCFVNRRAELHFCNEHLPTVKDLATKKVTFSGLSGQSRQKHNTPKPRARESRCLDLVHGLTILVRVVEVAVVVQRDPLAKDILASAA